MDRQSVQQIVVKSLNTFDLRLRGGNCGCLDCLKDNIKHLEVDMTDPPTPGRLAYFNKEQNKRLQLKIGRWVKKYFTHSFSLEVSDKTIQDVSCEISAMLYSDLSGGVNELTGEAIRDFYLNGDVSSCMAHENTQNFLDIYVDNPEVVSLATIRIGNHAGRALVWNIEGVKYMDRLYHTSNACEAALIQYRDSHGYKTRDDLYKDEPSVEMKIRNGTDSYWPFLDTMSGMIIVDNKHCVLSPRPLDYYLQETDGTCDGRVYVCFNCGERLNEEDVFTAGDNDYCEECYSELFTSCGECGEAVDNDCIYEVEDDYLCEDCYDRLASACNDCGVSFYAKNLTETDEGYVCEDCLEKYTLCDNCGVYTTDFEEHEDQHLCKDCMEDIDE